MSIFEEMVVVELRSRSRVRAGFGMFLHNYCRESAFRIGDHAASLGQRRAPANLFCFAPLVSSRGRFDFSDRVRVAVGPDRRTDRVEWNYASSRLSPRSS